jgi:hypothetical protein
MRYFRANVAVYESICSQLDAAYGYPNTATKTLRALPLANELPTDQDGMVYLAISSEYCDYVLPSELLPQLLASGAVQEITEEVYRSTLPESPAL